MTTILITGDFLVNQGYGSSNDYVFTFAGTTSEESLYNANTGTIAATGTSPGAITTAGTAPASSQITNHGVIEANVTGADGFGIAATLWSPSLNNQDDGSIDVTSNQAATGALLGGSAADVSNAGSISAQ